MSNIDSFIHDEEAHNEAYARVTCPHCLEECDSVEECECQEGEEREESRGVNTNHFRQQPNEQQQ